MYEFLKFTACNLFQIHIQLFTDCYISIIVFIIWKRKIKLRIQELFCSIYSNWQWNKYCNCLC